jgi:hypothetical protein
MKLIRYDALRCSCLTLETARDGVATMAINIAATATTREHDAHFAG